jgi:glyoxylase-like metal-dependent hydrolase (beta-lactamase superfamily II)
MNGATLFGFAFNQHKADKILEDDDIIEFGGSELRVVHTPGHSAGSVCFLGEGSIFTGDTLFAASVGRTDLPGGSWERLKESLKNRLMNLEASLTVYPGHGEKTTLARELGNNPFLIDLR